jgi:Na+/H+ antiporter NhaD/arsenite permease-like protein
MPWWSTLPFAALLGCIAVFPLFHRTAHLWEHRGFQLAVALSAGVPMAIWMWALGDSAAVVHALVEYGQFITLLLSLFVVSGGIFLSGDIRATPRNNALFLAAGGLVASFVGTTGAAMLLIRPLLNTNRERQHKVHTVVFAILIVANCGGLLTPLGDPPLFLGMLRGVPFLWTMQLFPEWLFVNGLLLLTYVAIDKAAYAKETPEAIHWDDTAITPLGLKGKWNFLWLLAIVAAVAQLPSVDLHAIHEGHASLAAWVPWREGVMLSAAALSYFFGDKVARFEDNKFTWGPIQEVAALFIGIFLAMVPALKFLGQVAPTLPLNEVTFFLFTGGLSSVLDNAPTYATFFEMARQLPGEARVAGVPQLYLVAISLGAVFCGALTYIGNGPNFMVKAVAESTGVKMPSFGGYAVWALRYLGPILVAMMLIFVAQGMWAHLAGGGLALALALVQLRAIWFGPQPAARPSVQVAGAAE